MDLIKKIEETNTSYKKLQNMLDEKEKEMVRITDELKRLQGSYRTLIQLGVEDGVLDETGKPIK